MSVGQGRSSALVLHIPTEADSQVNNLTFISHCNSCVDCICVSDARQKLEAPLKEKHKKNKEKHKTKKEHRWKKEKVSDVWVSWDQCVGSVAPASVTPTSPQVSRIGPLKRVPRGHNGGTWVSDTLAEVWTRHSNLNPQFSGTLFFFMTEYFHLFSCT